MRARWLAVFGLLALTSPAAADDVEPEPLQVKLENVSGRALTTFDVTSAFTEAFRKRIAGGLTSRVLIEMALFDTRDQLVVTRKRECKLRMDIWDDVLEVRIDDAGRKRRMGFLLIDNALRACGRLRRVDLADMTALRYLTGYRMRVTVRLNPVSKELLRQSREFMSNPRGTGTDSQRSFFGAIARLFSSKTKTGDDIYFFEALSLTRPGASR